MRKILILASLAALAACSRPVDKPEAAGAASAASDIAGGHMPAPPKLAYAFRFGLEAPPDRVGELFEKHQKACLDATASVCQIVGAHFDRDRDGEPFGRLELRATSAWIGAFKGGLGEEVRHAGGELKHEESQATDISDEIAGAKAAVQHDERVSRPTEATHEELANARSTLNQDTARLAMSSVSLSYDAAPQFVGRDTWRPVSQAARMSAKMTSMSLAVLFTVLVTLAPWAGLGLLLWLGCRFVSARMARRIKTKAA